MIKNKNTMKIKTLLLLFVFVVSSSSTFSVLKCNSGDGGMGDGGVMIYTRSAFIPPIMTVITPKSNIEMIFTTNIGVVYATIKNNVGLIVSRSQADTSLDPNLQINIANLPSGAYSLSITDKQGATIKNENFTVD